MKIYSQCRVVQDSESMAKPGLRQLCGVFVLNKLKNSARNEHSVVLKTQRNQMANGVGKRGSTRESKTLETSVATGLYLTLTTLTEEILRPQYD